MRPSRGIDLPEDPAFRRRSWAIERVGWAVLGVILAAALLGLLGPGLLPRARLVGPLRVEYDRFARWHNDGELRIHLAPGARTLWVENRYLEAVELRTVRPSPVAVAGRPGWTVYTFDADDDAQGAEVCLEFSHRRFGRVRGRVGSSPKDAVRVLHIVYP